MVTYTTGAVILAAGAGTRFGGPKALARSESQTWLDLALETTTRAGFRWISVVLGAQAEQVRVGCAAAGRTDQGAVRVSWVVNDAWRAGRTGSLVCGLKDLPAGTRGALVHAVDFPEVRAATLRVLASTFEGTAGAETLILEPTQGGRRGHPILIGSAVWPEIHDLGPDEPLYTVIRRDPARRREVPVPDPGIHRNINLSSEREGS